LIFYGTLRGVLIDQLLIWDPNEISLGMTG